MGGLTGGRECKGKGADRSIARGDGGGVQRGKRQMGKVCEGAIRKSAFKWPKI